MIDTSRAPHGFRRSAMGDHELARFLRRHGAIDTWSSVENSNMWRAPDGRAVAVAFYDNAAPSYTLYIREDLTDEGVPQYAVADLSRRLSEISGLPIMKEC